MWRNEQRKSIERPFGEDLLGDSDARVRHQDPEKQGVSPIAEHERNHPKARQD